MATGPVDRYRQWLQKNTELLAPMEIGFSALAYYAVSRSGEMSIAAEASYAAVGLFTLLNESVLTSDRATTPRNERLALAALDQVSGLHKAVSLYELTCPLVRTASNLSILV